MNKIHNNLFRAKKEDMEFGKYRRQIFKKHYYDTSKMAEEIDIFNDVTSGYWDACTGQFKINQDNTLNMRKFNNDKNDYDYYSRDSKHWSLVDPSVEDPKSIQTTSLNRVYMLFKNRKSDIWEFPTIPLLNGDSFEIAKLKLFFNVTKEFWKIFFPPHHPAFAITRDFHEYEREDPKNKGLKGVRTYYFHAFHFRGIPMVYPNLKHNYTDYSLVPKIQMNKWVGENYYRGIITNLTEK